MGDAEYDPEIENPSVNSGSKNSTGPNSHSTTSAEDIESGLNYLKRLL